VTRKMFPRLAGIIGAIETAARLRLDERVDAVRIGGRDGEVRLPNELRRQSRRDLGEMLTAVGALVEADAGRVLRAADDRPRLSLAAPHPGVNDVRVGGVQLEIGRTDAVGHEEDFLPGLAAVGRLEDTAFSVRLERVSDRGNPNDIWLGRVNTHRGDLSGVVQAGEAPRISAVGRFVDASTRRDIAPDVVGARPEIDDIRIRLRHRNRPGGCDRYFAVRDRHPARAGLRRSEDAATRDSHIEGTRLRRHARHRRDAASTRRTYDPELEAAENRGV